jgi:hypothetical protein
MKRLLLFAFVYCCLLAESNAQLKSIDPRSFSSTWYEGSVVFATGDTIRCHLRFNQAIPDGVLQIRESQTVLTLPVKDVKAFSFFDEKRDRVRSFYAVTFNDNIQGERDYFMECLYNDKTFSILKHKTVDVNYDFMNYSRFISRHSRMIKQYILNASTGELLPMSKENVLRLMDNRKSNVMSFIDDNNIKFKSVSDYIHVFQYHSSL